MQDLPNGGGGGAHPESQRRQPCRPIYVAGGGGAPIQALMFTPPPSPKGTALTVPLSESCCVGTWSQNIAWQHDAATLLAKVSR